MSFDRIARPYQLLETIAFGNALQRARTYWIDLVPATDRALIVGEGNGRFLCELLRRHPKTNIDCVDASERMLKLARMRVRETLPESLPRVRFLQKDVLNWSPPDSYDLLVTHFLLDCFSLEEVEQVVQKLARAAMPNAVWLIADFTIPPKRFARMHANIWLRVMYSFFRLAAGITTKELVDATPYLQANGFILELRRLSRARMLKSELFRR